jgi:hypothetical protein
MIAVPLSTEKAVCVNFGFSLKSMQQHTSESLFLGFARVNLQELFKAEAMILKRCPIISEKEMIVGSILVKLQLDSDKGKI